MKPENKRGEDQTLLNENGEVFIGTAEQKETFPAGGLGLLEHLKELRSRLIKSLLSLVPGFILAYNFAAPILSFLARPLQEALPPGSGLVATALPDTFIVHLKIGIWGGFFMASPFWLYQIWAFVAPGLYGPEKKGLKRLSFFGTLLMAAGAAFAYYGVIPIAFKFFVSVTGAEVTMLPAIKQYLSLIMGLLAAFGLTFQLPLVLLLLASLGLVNGDKLRSFRRYAILIIFILAAVLTPPDVISQIMLALPMLALYELSLFLISRKYQPDNRAANPMNEKEM